MQPGSAKLEWRHRLHGESLHSSFVDPESMPQASQWSSKFVILAGQAGQGNASLTEILVGAISCLISLLLRLSASGAVGLGGWNRNGETMLINPHSKFFTPDLTHFSFYPY